MITDKQVQALVELTQEKAMKDKYRGRTTWVKRWMMLHLLIGAKLSVKEITQLRICDVNLSCKVSCIRSFKGTQIIIDEALAVHIKEFLQIKKARGEPVDNYDYFLTPSSDGRAYSRMSIFRLYHATLKAAGLPRIKPNDFLMSVKK